MSIAENVARVQQRIATAALRSGRRSSEVTLIAVSKYVDSAATRELLAAGCRDLGEARPQSLWQKADEVVDAEIRWHLIGHLQSNKIRRTLPLVSLIHSVDSEKLLAAIEAEVLALGRVVSVLLEVNVSGETAKHGFEPANVANVVERSTEWSHLQIRGLMGMAALNGDIEIARRNFAALRELRDTLLPKCPPTVTLTELSMGMSGDYEVAIEEGATMVRVGSALFDKS